MTHFTQSTTDSYLPLAGNSTLPSVRDTINQIAEILLAQGFQEPRLEAELLVRYVLNLNQTKLYLQVENAFPAKHRPGLQHLIQRRLNYEPMAYITGQKEFYGLMHYVNTDVIVPRPETETLVEQTIKVAAKYPTSAPRIIDIGTGCGAIAITLAVYMPGVNIIATDISIAALRVAHQNCITHRVNNQIQLLQTDLLDPINRYADILVANLPYIRDADADKLSHEIRNYEPESALFGGRDGLREINRLLEQAKHKLTPGGFILLEISPEQQVDVKEMANRNYPGSSIEIIPDLSGIERVIVIQTSM